MRRPRKNNLASFDPRQLSETAAEINRMEERSLQYKVSIDTYADVPTIRQSPSLAPPEDPTSAVVRIVLRLSSISSKIFDAVELVTNPVVFAFKTGADKVKNTVGGDGTLNSETAGEREHFKKQRNDRIARKILEHRKESVANEQDSEDSSYNEELSSLLEQLSGVNSELEKMDSKLSTGETLETNEQAMDEPTGLDELDINIESDLDTELFPETYLLH